MKLETLKERVIKAEAKLEKRKAIKQKMYDRLAKKMEKIQNPNDLDVIAATRDVIEARQKEEEARKALEKARKELNEKITVADVVEANMPKAIEEFFARWEKAFIECWMEKMEEMKKLRSEDFQKFKNEMNKHGAMWWERITWTEADWKKEAAREKEVKMYNLVRRVRKVVGVITDEEGLYLDERGEINGVVVGTDGKAAVSTIIAGGWNIQRIHFRTLVRAC